MNSTDTTNPPAPGQLYADRKRALMEKLKSENEMLVFLAMSPEERTPKLEESDLLLQMADQECTDKIHAIHHNDDYQLEERAAREAYEKRERELADAEAQYQSFNIYQTRLKRIVSAQTESERWPIGAAIRADVGAEIQRLYFEMGEKSVQSYNANWSALLIDAVGRGLQADLAPLVKQHGFEMPKLPSLSESKKLFFFGNETTFTTRRKEMMARILGPDLVEKIALGLQQPVAGGAAAGGGAQSTTIRPAGIFHPNSSRELNLRPLQSERRIAF
jgi:hypothetical protein